MEVDHVTCFEVQESFTINFVKSRLFFSISIIIIDCGGIYYIHNNNKRGVTENASALQFEFLNTT